MPVKLDSGRARLFTSLASTGSPLKPNTTGMPLEKRSMASVQNSWVTTTSGFPSTISRTTCGKSSGAFTEA